MRRDAERLRDILEAIERIERYAKRGRTTFENDELIQVWVVNHLQIIGEAVRALSSALREKHTAVPWRQMNAMRNILVHQYFDIDTEIVWQVVQRDLPDLKREIAAILLDLESGLQNSSPGASSK